MAVVMMDAEMLELAAKAVGIEGAVCYSSGEFMRYPDFYASWSPLAINEEAFKLAIAARLDSLGAIIDASWDACESNDEREAYVRREIVRHVAIRARG